MDVFRTSDAHWVRYKKNVYISFADNPVNKQRELRGHIIKQLKGSYHELQATSERLFSNVSVRIQRI